MVIREEELKKSRIKTESLRFCFGVLVEHRHGLDLVKIYSFSCVNLISRFLIIRALLRLDTKLMSREYFTILRLACMEDRFFHGKMNAVRSFCLQVVR